MAKPPTKKPTKDIDATAQTDGVAAADRPEWEQFLDRMNGTLPEQLTERDLDTLNAALRFLFADLRRARQLFQASDGHHDRAGAIRALGPVWRFIALFQQPLAENLHLPILQLATALMALDDNTVVPMLQPPGEPGRGRSTVARAALRGCAAGTVTRLVKAGLTNPQARELVAKTLTKLGIRPERGSGEITADTIRHWYDEVAADVGHQGEAAAVYDGMFTDEERRRFFALPSDEARRLRAIESLADFIRAVFPETQKPS
jgi:hypothetical protein